MFWFLRGHSPPASHCPGKLYFPGGGGFSVKRLKYSRASSSPSGAIGPSSITSTIWLRWKMSCRAVVTMPGSAEGEVLDGLGVGSLREELAPSVALGVSNSGDGQVIVPAVAKSSAPGATRLLVRVVIIPRRALPLSAQAGWRQWRWSTMAYHVCKRLQPSLTQLLKIQ